MTATCAIRAAVITGHVHREPLGKNSGMVAVCDACRTETPVALYHERSYEPQGGMLRAPALTESMRRVMGDEAYEAEIARIQKAATTPARALTKEERDLVEYDTETRRRFRSRAHQIQERRSSRVKTVIE